MSLLSLWRIDAYVSHDGSCLSLLVYSCVRASLLLRFLSLVLVISAGTGV